MAERYEAKAKLKSYAKDAQWMLIHAAVHRVLADMKEQNAVRGNRHSGAVAVRGAAGRQRV